MLGPENCGRSRFFTIGSASLTIPLPICGGTGPRCFLRGDSEEHWRTQMVQLASLPGYAFAGLWQERLTHRKSILSLEYVRSARAKRSGFIEKNLKSVT